MKDVENIKRDIILQFQDIKGVTDMALLVDWEILEKKSEGKIIISPFDKKQLNTVSYDVTLGENYFRARYVNESSVMPRHFMLLNPHSAESISERWSSPKIAEQASRVLNPLEMSRHGVNATDKIIFLAPNELILAHTREFIGGVSDVTTSMHARSTVGRCGFSVCMCAGFGDVGYYNRWTMEIHNNAEYWIVLTVGDRIAQIHFESVSKPTGLYSKGGHYQNTADLRQLKKNWKPEHMIPRPI